MGIKNSKTSAITTPTPIVNANKVDKSKMFRSFRNSSLFSFDGNNNYNIVSANIQETWRFTGGSKRIYNVKNPNILPNQQRQQYQNQYQRQYHQKKLIKEEIERLRRQNNLYNRIWQNNFSSPVEDLLKRDGIRILEVGCGAGHWTIEMAENYPASTFTGVDFSPMLFPEEKKPDNAKFIQANILDGLPFLDETFEFVNVRLMLTAFTATEWEDKVIPELVRVTRQGGYIELMESDIRYSNEGPATQRLTGTLLQFMKYKGIGDPINDYVLLSLLSNEKLVKDVKTEEKSCFVGKWSGELGELAVDDFTKGWNAVKLPMSSLIRVKSQDYDGIVNIFEKEVEQYRTCFKIWRFSIQKVSTISSSPLATTPSWQN